MGYIIAIVLIIMGFMDEDAGDRGVKFIGAFFVLALTIFIQVVETH